VSERKKISTEGMREMLAQLADKPLRRDVSDHPRTDAAKFMATRKLGEESDATIIDECECVRAEFAADLEAENAGLLKELGRNTDEPSPTGSVYALKNYWKLRCDELSEENAGLRGVIDGIKWQAKLLLRAVEENDPVSQLRIRADDIVAAAEKALRGKGGASLADAICEACVPGGQSCDPQQVADAIREFLK
jgi:hypothetical protein